MQPADTWSFWQQRRPSLWDKITSGYVNTSQADVAGTKKADAQGFAPVAAKFDDSFGSNALWETTLNGPKSNPEKQRERNVLGEDALRQMS